MRKYMNVTLYRSARVLAKKRVFAPLAAGAAVLTTAVTGALADSAALFTAVDLTTFDTNLTTIVTTLIGISIMGAAYVYIKRALPGSF